MFSYATKLCLYNCAVGGGGGAAHLYLWHWPLTLKKNLRQWHCDNGTNNGEKHRGKTPMKTKSRINFQQFILTTQRRSDAGAFVRFRKWAEGLIGCVACRLSGSLEVWRIWWSGGLEGGIVYKQLHLSVKKHKNTHIQIPSHTRV